MKSFPYHNILSEEDDFLDRRSEFTWVLDPIDGTLPYTIKSSDHFGVSIGLAGEKIPVLGVIYLPLRKELYWAEKGEGAYLNEKRICVAETEDIRKAFLGIDFGVHNRSRILPFLEKLLDDGQGITYPLTYACATASLCLFAQGKIDGYLALDLEPWDLAAAAVIVQEVGGKFTNPQGDNWNIKEKSVLAANPSLHKKLLGILHESLK